MTAQTSSAAGSNMGVQWAFAHAAVPGFNLAEIGWRAYF
jgi:hypothetical protein